MDPRRAISDTQKVEQQPSPQKDQGKQPKDPNTELQHLLPSPIINFPGKESPQPENRSQKRERLHDDTSLISTDTPSRKRPRSSPPRSPIEDTTDDNTVVVDSGEEIDENATDENTVVVDSGEEISPLEYWRNKFLWPKRYFEPESNIPPLLANEQSSSSSFHEQQSEASFATPSDQKPRPLKSAFYISPMYANILAIKGSHMKESDPGVTDATKNLCRILLETEQTFPRDSLFRDDIFNRTCGNIGQRNGAKVIQDITRLIAPSAEALAIIYGAKHLDSLIESVNEGWNTAIPFYGPRPQPDYSVGFRRSAFSGDEFEKLEPFIGELSEDLKSYFMSTYEAYFSFLTCEVKCGIEGLDVADRQNAHSMTLAVRGIVELFRLAKREKEIHREILAFSISHDHCAVRIYGHYALIDRSTTTFFRYLIKNFVFTNEQGKDKWTAYQFTKNVYDIWMPTHLDRIRSVINELPTGLDFAVSAI